MGLSQEVLVDAIRELEPHWDGWCLAAYGNEPDSLVVDMERGDQIRTVRVPWEELEASSTEAGLVALLREHFDQFAPTEPTPLRPIEHPQVPEVVTFLEDLLERAKAGEILGIAVGAACTGREDGHGFVLGNADLATLGWALDRAKLALLDYDPDAEEAP